MKQTRRSNDLIKLLIQKNDFFPTSFYSDILNVSEKTIYNDIQELEPHLKQYNLSIIKKPRHGIKLEGLQTNIDKLITKLKFDSNLDSNSASLKRQIEIIRRLIVENQSTSYEELSKELFASASSIRIDIEKINQKLKASNVRVVSDKFGTKVAGSQQEIQRAFTQFVFMTFEEEYPYQHINLEAIKNFIDEIFVDSMCNFADNLVKDLVISSSKKMTDNYICYLYISLLILLSRVYHNQHVEIENNLTYQMIEQLEQYLLSSDIAVRISNKLGIVLEEEDILYLSHILLAHGVESYSNHYLPDMRFKLQVKQMISNMSSILRVDMREDERLYNALIAHIIPMIHRAKNNFMIRCPLLEAIKKQYQVMFSLTWYVLRNVENMFQVSLSDDEVAFLTVHFQVAFDRIYKSRKVVLTLPKSLATAELLYSSIREIISQKDYLEVISDEQINDYNLTDVDFVIATRELNIKNKVIYVSPIMTNAERQEIVDYYLMISTKAHELKARGKTSELQQFLKRENLYLNKDFETKEECIDFIVDDFVKRGLVSKNTGIEIHQRESLGSTSIDTGVAVPHASPSNVISSNIALMTLKKPISWGGVKISLVILMAFAQSDYDRMVDVFSQIYNAIDEKGKVIKLSLVNSYGDVIDNFID